MGDPLSISASIVALLQLSATVIRFLRDVKDAPDDLKRLTIEDLVDLGETGLETVQSLSVLNGPLEQCQSTLKRLTKKLDPASGFRKMLAWPFQKEEVRDILGMIERQKMLFSLALQNDHFGLSRAIKADLAEVKDDVQELRKGQRDKESRDIIAWLSTLNFPTRQNDIFCRRQEGTGEWFLDTDAFKRWLDGNERTLWCPGLPGAGKTVLTSIIIDHLEKSFKGKDIAVAYIYCSYKEQEDQTDANLIASLLQQIVQRGPSISDKLSSVYNRHIQKQTRPVLSEWLELLKSESRHFSKLFIVIDAFDEFSERNGTRDSFFAEIRTLPNMHLLVTSRHISTIESLFEKTARVEVRAIDTDVRRYLECRIEREGRLVRHVKADPSLKETIVDTVVAKAKGMFLLAQLHTDALVSKGTRKEVRKALETLPKELDSTYEEAMRRIESQNNDDKQLAERVLFWISFALRPLTLKELQHALAVEPDETDLDEENLPDEELLTSVCAGLVTVDQESDIIRLVHYTTQEYFERIRTTRFPDAQTIIATTCLLYISFNAFAGGACRSNEEMKTRLRKYPLLVYAANHWDDHARGDPEEAIKDLVINFLEDGPKFSCYNQVINHTKPWLLPTQVTGLHLIASLGLAGVMQLLLSHEGANVNLRDLSGRTPLSRAAENGHERVVQMLLSCEGIDINGTPLSWAAENGHERVVQTLLSCEGIDINLGDLNGSTPLSRAAENGHESVVQLLLSHEGIEVNSKDNDGRTPLFWAASYGYERVVQLLLSHESIEVNSKDSDGRTPLFLAAENGHESVVQLLLSHEGIEVNSKDSDGLTPLFLAAENGHESVVQLLLSHEGIEVNSKDSDGLTPLFLAAENGHESVVQLLLSHEGIEVNSKDSDGLTPLSRAIKNKQIVRRNVL
ncbi:MAG: hypothetical protein M1840_002641 [Geoglossum simile]|nr:MAG: hypothetical protein M1840_002641 [Geoglossum simile]